jgi:hypothetical protein
VPPSAPLTAPPTLVKVAWSAVEEFLNRVTPPNAVLNMPPLLTNCVSVPALALLENCIRPVNAPLTVVAKFCVTPELFVIPTPLRVNAAAGGVVMVFGRVAAELKMMPFSWVLDDSEMECTNDPLKVAVSAGPLGIVAGLQLLAAFQSVVAGVNDHVALPARAASPDSDRPSAREMIARRKTVGQMSMVRSLSEADLVHRRISATTTHEGFAVFGL